MSDIVKQILSKPIQLADLVVKTADEATYFKSECAEVKTKAEKLAGLLRQAARASNDLYERPTRRIVDDTEQALGRAHALAQKCRAHGLVKRVFTVIPAAAFRKAAAQLESSIGDVSWLLRVSASDGGDEYLGLPPIAANEPILGLIWEQIAILSTGKVEDRADAAASLVSLARDNERYGKLIIEEGGVGPLLRLVKEGKVEGQENAARAIGLLGRDRESVEQMIHAGVCQVFAKILKDGPMKVQAVVAWAVSELAAHHSPCQDQFAQHNIIRLLVSHLAFETIQEHSKYSITSKSLHAIVVAANKSPNGYSNGSSSSNGYLNGYPNGYHSINKPSLNGNIKVDDPMSHSKIQHPLGNAETHQMHKIVSSTMAINNQSKLQQVSGVNPPIQTKLVRTNSSHSLTGAITKGRENEDPETKAYMKAMAARALCHLAKGNSPICRSITESRALLCFAVLLEKGPDDVMYNSAMALTEITAVAEKDPDLRRSAFKPNSPACKAVVDQVLSIIEKADSRSELLIPCMKSVGNLARTFRATETRMISPLVRLLDDREAEVSREACIALTKFACNENYLHLDHCKAIIDAGGAKHLVQLAYFGEQIVQSPSVTLLCYIAMNVPDSEQLAEIKVLTVLEWASKQPLLVQDGGDIEALLQEAKSRLELYQSRGDSRRFP